MRQEAPMVIRVEKPSVNENLRMVSIVDLTW